MAELRKKFLRIKNIWRAKAEVNALFGMMLLAYYGMWQLYLKKECNKRCFANWNMQAIWFLMPIRSFPPWLSVAWKMFENEEFVFETVPPNSKPSNFAWLVQLCPPCFILPFNVRFYLISTFAYSSNVAIDSSPFFVFRPVQSK